MPEYKARIHKMAIHATVILPLTISRFGVLLEGCDFHYEWLLKVFYL